MSRKSGDKTGTAGESAQLMQNANAEIAIGPSMAPADVPGQLPKPKKNWGKDRENQSYNVMFLQFATVAQILGQLVLLLFLFAFILGGTDWQPFGWAVGLTVFDGLSFIYFTGLWLYVTFMNPEFFWLRYGVDELENSISVEAEINQQDTASQNYHKLEKRRSERKRSFNMFMVVLIVALVIKIPIVWTWLENNPKWIPKTVGGTTPNTPSPSYVHYWRFYLNSGIELFACLTVIVAAVVFFFRLWDDNKTFDEDHDGSVNIFGPYDSYTISGWIAYVILMLYHFLWVLVIAGSTEVPMTLLLVLICFVAFFTLVMWARFVIFPPKDTGTMRNDVRYRCLASIIYLIMLNIWQIIFFAYYYSAATSKEKGDGHFPRFQPSRAAVGQYNFYYYAQLTAVINIASWVWSAGFFCQHAWVTTHHDPTSLVSLEAEKKEKKEQSKAAKSFYKLVLNQRSSINYILLFVFAVYVVIVFGFAMNETTGSVSYLASRFWVWTITTSVLFGVFWLIHLAISASLLHDEIGKVQHWHSEPVLVSFIMVTVFVVVYIWLFVFYQVNYNSLGKSSSNAAVNDPADHLSVVVPQLFGIYVLGTIAFLYFLVDFVSHPIYLIKITEKSSKV